MTIAPLTRLGALAAPFVSALVLAACGSASHAGAGTGTARSATASRCLSSGVDVPRTGVQFRDGASTLGVVLLRRSVACGTAWGVALGMPADTELELSTVHEPDGRERTVHAHGPYTRAGISGAEVAESHGCVLGRAKLLRAGRVLAQAQTPCG